MNFEDLLLGESGHWKVFLHKNQHYLGRSYVWAKGEEVTDLLDITPDERNDLFGISERVKKALTEIFNPDLFNYASLGNISSHLHLHIIPRYKTPREFGGQTFVDFNWGHNYAPYDYEFEVPEELLFKIRDKIRRELK